MDKNISISLQVIYAIPIDCWPFASDYLQEGERQKDQRSRTRQGMTYSVHADVMRNERRVGGAYKKHNAAVIKRSRDLEGGGAGP